MIKIAIVDDHKMIREGIKLLINQQEGMEIVAEFSNGLDWVNSVKYHQYDISLVDIDMPQLDGISALADVLNNNKEQKVIMLSMHSDVNYFRDAFVKGAKGFVLKDMSVSELSTAIREVHKGNTYFSDDFLKSLANNLKQEQENSSNLGHQLSEPEHRLLTYICKGYTNKQLAEQLFLSVKTIESQKTKLMRKTHTQNNAGLIVWAIKNNVVEV